MNRRFRRLSMDAFLRVAEGTESHALCKAQRSTASVMPTGKELFCILASFSAGQELQLPVVFELSICRVPRFVIERGEVIVLHVLQQNHSVFGIVYDV